MKIIPKLHEANFEIVPPARDSEGRDIDSQIDNLKNEFDPDTDKVDVDSDVFKESRTLTKRDLRRMKYLSNKYLFKDLKEGKDGGEKIRNLAKTVFDKEHLLKEGIGPDDPYIKMFDRFFRHPELVKTAALTNDPQRLVAEGLPFTDEHITALGRMIKDPQYRELPLFANTVGSIMPVLKNRFMRWAKKYDNIQMTPAAVAEMESLSDYLNTNSDLAVGGSKLDASLKGQTAHYLKKQGRESDIAASGIASKHEENAEEYIDNLLQSAITDLETGGGERPEVTSRIIGRINDAMFTKRQSGLADYMIPVQDKVDPVLLLKYGVLSNNTGVVKRAYNLEGKGVRDGFDIELREQLLQTPGLNKDIIRILKFNRINENAMPRTLYITEEQLNIYLNNNRVDESNRSDAEKIDTPDKSLAYKGEIKSDYAATATPSKRSKAASSATKAYGYKYPSQVHKKTMSLDSGDKVNKSEIRNDYYVKESIKNEGRAIISKKELLELLGK